MKSKILLFILTLALLLSPQVSYAGGNNIFGGLIKPKQQNNTVRTLINANNEIGLSYNYLTQYYTERIGDNESGGISGIGLSITGLGNILSVPMVYEHIGYTNQSGSFNYADGADGVNATDNSNILGISARVGKAFILNSKTMLIPYIAYNYRKWDRSIGNGYAGGIEYSGYQEIYSYDALGLGLIGQYAVNKALVLKGRVQYSQILGNTLNAYNVSGYPAMTFNLGDRPVYTIGAGVDYDIDGTPFHITAGIKYSRIFFGKSAANSDGLYEAASMTTDVNYSLGLAYSF
ncbi:MAG: hypothetical protein ACYCT7_09300 [bacterium]